MKSNPSYHQSAGHGKDWPKIPDDFERPVERVPWNAVQSFLKTLNQQHQNLEARLPTEAEWEYACRAGSTGFFSGLDFQRHTLHASRPYGIAEFAWYAGTSGNENIRIRPVAQKKPNAWGFYDMHGNVWELCSDHFQKYTGSPIDPIGKNNWHDFSCRGGSYNSEATECRSAARSVRGPDDERTEDGFRLAISASLKP
jgi:formylglycine-generating enzyme required for sulfatase activity